MSRPLEQRAQIAPVTDGLPRPTWSVMIPTYNCARLLGETLQSVLDQAPGPGEMQIEVVDDGSSDDPEAVVRAVAGDRVVFHRQPQNVGHIRNFATCLNRARGRYVHLLHGDDRVERGFYAALQAGFEAAPEVGAAFCRHRFINVQSREISIPEPEQPSPGVLAGGVERLAEEQRIMTPSIAVRREAYEKLGGFDPRLACSEDWEMWVRIAAHYPVWYEPSVLAGYRMHQESNTGRHYRMAEELGYTRRAIEIFADYLPPQKARAIVRRARLTYADTALNNARQLARSGDLRGMQAHLMEAIKMSSSPTVLRRAAKIAFTLNLNAGSADAA
ncbi:glycosyltransferase [Phenylobacterium sp.]|uniref:glycosyltransferase n=1 Tax=Phenylobacterium sp. TaxID=1871053 RepID=UPI00289B783E|nr:glycosyltransferase [Phenylobacterium sp.]